MRAIEVGLFDGSFSGQLSATLGSRNVEIGPKYIEWVRNEVRDVTVFTDMHIGNVEAQDIAKNKFAWILEPDWLLRGDNAINVRSKFDVVLTSNMNLSEQYGPKYQYTPIGGSWIEEDNWGIHEKSKIFSMMTTNKQKAPGHQLRHEITKRLRDEKIPVDLFGRGSNPIKSKTTALSDYHYSIVVESYAIHGYFTEKIIDCMSQGTIPIYWGDPSIGRRFVTDAIIPFQSADELVNIILRLESPGASNGLYLISQGYEFYESQKNNIAINLELARRYRCAEDRIFEDYPYLLT